jgi:hypothetical protein
MINNSCDIIQNNEIEKKLNEKLSKDELKKNNNINTDKNFPLIHKKIESDKKDDNNDTINKSRKIISTIKDIKDSIDINSPKSEVNNNTDKMCNLNSEIETNTETMNSKMGVFGQKLTDIEIFMKKKFFELAKQINEIKQQNNFKKKNLNRTVGYKSDKNIFNFLNNDLGPNNYSINIKDEAQNMGNYRVIKLQKQDLYSHYFPSDLDAFKRNDYIKDSCTIDNWNKKCEKINEDISVVKQFIEKKINIKTKNQDYYKKGIKGIFRDKNYNNPNGGIDAYDKIRNNSSSVRNDMKYVDLKVLINRKIPKNSYQKMNKTQFGNSFLPNKSYFYRDFSDLSVASKNSKILSEDRFNNNLNDIELTPDDNLLFKLKNVSIEKKYINLYNYLEKCLDNFYSDIKSKMKKKNIIKIDFESLRKLKFNEYSTKEQYILLILLMNHIIPLIYVYFNSNSNGDILENNLFKTDLNLNYTILNKIYGNPTNIIKRSFITKDNKLSVELCMNKQEEIFRRNSLFDLLLRNKTKFT